MYLLLDFFFIFLGSVFMKNNDKLYRNIRRCMNIIMMVLSFAMILYFIKTNKYNRIYTAILIYPVLYLPELLDNTKYFIDYKYKMIYCLFIFMADFLGCIVNLYKYISWYDLFIHFVSGIMSFVLGYLILEKSKLKLSGMVKFFYLVGFVAFVALCWEIIEFTGDQVFGLNLQHNMETGVLDTMSDMIMGFMGGICSYIFISKRKS